MSTTDPSPGPWSAQPRSTRVPLTPSAESAAQARSALRELLTTVNVGQQERETAVLLANELVINAVEHSGAPAHLHAIVRDGLIRLEVTDASPVLPTANVSVDELDERGRGLLMISALSSRWGTDPLPDGKIVWCEIDRT